MTSPDCNLTQTERNWNPGSCFHNLTLTLLSFPVLYSFWYNFRYTATYSVELLIHTKLIIYQICALPPYTESECKDSRAACVHTSLTTVWSFSFVYVFILLTVTELQFMFWLGIIQRSQIPNGFLLTTGAHYIRPTRCTGYWSPSSATETEQDLRV